MNEMLEMKRILNAERACKNSMTDWSKDFWFNVFRKLCTKYNCTDYFKKVSN